MPQIRIETWRFGVNSKRQSEDLLGHLALGVTLADSGELVNARKRSALLTRIARRAVTAGL